MEADVDVLQLGRYDVFAGDLDAGLIVLQDGDGCTVAHAEFM